MELIRFAKLFINYVYDRAKIGIDFAECSLEKQGLGEQKDQVIDYVYSLHKQGKTKQEAINAITL